MDPKQERFMQELLEDFKVEAAEHLTLYTKGLLSLEEGASPEASQKIIEEIFREIHSAKGAARAVNLPEIERVCQSLESALASLKAGRINLSAPLLDALHNAGDFLRAMLQDLTEGTKQVSSELAMAMVFLMTDIAQGKAPLTVAAPKSEPTTVVEEVVVPEVQSAQENLRISAGKLRSLMVQAEEFITMKSMLKSFSREVSEISSSCNLFRKSSENMIKSLDPGVNPDQMDYEEGLKWYKANSRELHERLIRLSRRFNQYHHDTARMVDELLLDIRKTLLVPFIGTLDLFPKMVRDLPRR